MSSAEIFTQRAQRLTGNGNLIPQTSVYGVELCKVPVGEGLKIENYDP